jgi:hypothetical protein
MQESDIWHDVCTSCHPDYDMAICGTPMNYDPDEQSKANVEDGQDCVVCMGMMCQTCPPGIIGIISPQTNGKP